MKIRGVGLIVGIELNVLAKRSDYLSSIRPFSSNQRGRERGGAFTYTAPGTGTDLDNLAKTFTEGLNTLDENSSSN